MDAESRRKRKENDIDYLKKVCSLPVEGAIIKIDATDDGGADYEEIFGKNFLEEETLILGDDDNNVYLVFRKEEDETVVAKDITKNLHIVDKCTYDNGSHIHKRYPPANIPAHLKFTFETLIDPSERVKPGSELI